MTRSVAPSPGCLRFRPADVEAYVNGLPPKHPRPRVPDVRGVQPVRAALSLEKRYGVIAPNPRATQKSTRSEGRW